MTKVKLKKIEIEVHNMIFERGGCQIAVRVFFLQVYIFRMLDQQNTIVTTTKLLLLLTQSAIC